MLRRSPFRTDTANKNRVRPQRAAYQPLNKQAPDTEVKSLGQIMAIPRHEYHVFTADCQYLVGTVSAIDNIDALNKAKMAFPIAHPAVENRYLAAMARYNRYHRTRGEK